jgi:hypothetical protein
MTPDFDELVGHDLEPNERARLLRAHELLVAAGPPPELPPALAHPFEPREAEVVPFFNRRRHATIAVLAAALALALFGGGFLAGHHSRGGFSSERTIPMRATAAAPTGAIASIALGSKDEAGNWPMLVRVSNLSKLAPGGYYVLWLSRHGRPIAPCGAFVVEGPETQVQLNAPYKLNRFDGWVLTLQKPGQHKPGPILLKTV